jgi:hypothetical protein
MWPFTRKYPECLSSIANKSEGKQLLAMINQHDETIKLEFISWKNVPRDFQGGAL